MLLGACVTQHLDVFKEQEEEQESCFEEEAEDRV
jgi:hypothetical protein